VGLQRLIAEYGQLSRLDGHTPQSRGRRFNEVIAETLRCWGIEAQVSVRSAGEIDVAFAIDNQRYVLEAKWEQSKADTGDLAKLQRRVSQRSREPSDCSWRWRATAPMPYMRWTRVDGWRSCYSIASTSRPCSVGSRRDGAGLVAPGARSNTSDLPNWLRGFDSRRPVQRFRPRSAGVSRHLGRRRSGRNRSSCPTRARSLQAEPARRPVDALPDRPRRQPCSLNPTASFTRRLVHGQHPDRELSRSLRTC
jgi:hypothetical protein